MAKTIRFQKVLGGLENKDDRVIPGTAPSEGVRIAYFSDDGKNNFFKQFRNLTNYSNPPFAKKGGVNDRGCKILTPDGQLFHAIGYHGDLEGWYKDIKIGAHALSLKLAIIDNNELLIEDGRKFLLSDCTITFT